MDLFDHTAHETPPFKLPADGSCTAHRLSESSGYRIDVPDGELLFLEHFFAPNAADRARDFLQAVDGHDARRLPWSRLSAAAIDALHFTHIRWRQDSIRMYGKDLPLPRLTAWYGDQGCDYHYSGIDNPAQPWNDGLRKMKQAVENTAGVAFNSVMLNWYRNGEDHLGWHADDEPELGHNPVIASLSLGHARDFILRHNADPGRKIVLSLGHGSLLVMHGALQHHWQHAVPKRKRTPGSRFNLTFRLIRPTTENKGAPPP